MEYSGCWNGIAIVVGGIVTALAVVAIARRLFSPEALRQGHDATGNLLAIVGTLYAVLLGLVVVDAMARFERAMEVVQLESNCLADVFILAERLPEPQHSRIKDLCRTYAEQVVELEWPGDGAGEDERGHPPHGFGARAVAQRLRAPDRGAQDGLSLPARKAQ
ncbi:MAG: hypothetical protein ACKOHK_12070 [Planctomycetia bacterium]